MEQIAELGSMVVTPTYVQVGSEVLLAIEPWTQIALLLVSIIVGYATAPKPQIPKPAAFEDFDFPQFDEGTPQCVVFGDCWTADWMVLGVGNYRTTPVRTKSGKK